MKKLVTALFLSACLLVPAIVSAGPRHAADEHLGKVEFREEVEERFAAREAIYRNRRCFLPEQKARRKSAHRRLFRRHGKMVRDGPGRCRSRQFLRAVAGCAGISRGRGTGAGTSAQSD